MGSDHSVGEASRGTSLAVSDRSSTIAAMASARMDLLVVGGGATGAAIVREAALRGLRAGLIERDDFAGHTSSASSKLIHGGLRYLEHGHLRLVREGLSERRALMRLAPHLVQPLEFLLPTYRTDRRPRWQLRIGLFLYDHLARDRAIGRHEMLSAGALLARVPALRREALTGGARYFDARTDDARLVLAMLRSAASRGALVANYAEASHLLMRRGVVHGVMVRDRLSQNQCEIEATRTVNATGPFSDAWLLEMGVLERARLAPSKGCHIVFAGDRLTLPCALLLHSPRDGRVAFAIPWYGQAVIGTTETTVPDLRAPVVANTQDVEYLLEIARHSFPHAALTGDDVKSAWAGLRPLIKPDSGARNLTPRNLTHVARDFQVFESPRGLVSIIGGKLTAMRHMAAALLGPQPSATALSLSEPLVGAPPDGSVERGIGLLQQACPDLDGLAAEWLFMRHGTEAAAVANASADGRGRKPLAPGLPFLECELVHAARHELVVTLGDLLMRRVPVAALDVATARAVAERAASLVAPILGWDASEQQKQITDFASACLRYHAWRGRDQLTEACLSSSIR